MSKIIVEGIVSTKLEQKNMTTKIKIVGGNAEQITFIVSREELLKLYGNITSHLNLWSV